MAQSEQHEAFKERELDVLRLMAEGLTNREIGERLYIGVETVRWYAKQIYSKLEVSGREAASQRAQELGLLDDVQQNVPSVDHNLPAQLTEFIGRATELNDLQALFDNPKNRLVTVLAPGGMGKTRLALELARSIVGVMPASPDYADGVYFVGLQALGNPDQMIYEIAASIDYQFPRDSRDPTQDLFEHLSDQNMLLLIDNWEHVLEGAPLVSALLRAAPGVRVLATSREKLNLSNETIYALKGMDFPTWETREDALAYDAVKLLLQAAQRVRPDWEITQDNLDYVARVCRLTQGMPLGILLAAGWLDVYALERIAEELQRNIDFLETELRDVPERQRSIRAIFEWTWERLEPNERDVFMKLAVFRGGCTPAAESVTGANPRVLQSLVNKALLLRDKDGRFDLHELLRQYGEEQLEASGEIAPQTRDAHGAYYADLLRQSVSGILGESVQTGLATAGTELENAGVAWEWALQSSNFDLRWQFLGSLCWSYFFLSRYPEGALVYERAIAALEASESEAELRDLLAALLAFHALLSTYQDTPQAAEASALRAAALFAEIELGAARPELLDAYFALGLSRRYVQPEQAITIFETLLSLPHAGVPGAGAIFDWNLHWQIAHVTGNVLGNAAAARPLAKEALDRVRKSGALLGAAVGYMLMGQILYLEADYGAANSALQEALAIYRGLNEKYNFTGALTTAGRVAAAQDKHDEARRYFAEAILLLLDMGWTDLTRRLLSSIAEWLLERDENTRAAELAALVRQNSIVHPHIIKRTDDLLAELEAELPAEAFAAAVARGQAMDLKALMGDLLAELED